MVLNPPSPHQESAANRARARQPAAPMPSVKVATPASTEPTVLTLTTAARTNDIGDGEELFGARGGGRSKSEEEEDVELSPPLRVC